MKRAIVSSSVKYPDEPSLVHYQSSAFYGEDVTDLGWFRELVRAQSSFSFGLNAIKQPEIVEQMEQFCENGTDPADLLSSEIDNIKQDPSVPDETTRKALIDARCGQGKFRKALDERWDQACAVTKCALRPLLRASHIKPWRHATNEERLDPANGILLSANIDILFDKGFVSFDDRGRMLIASHMPASERRLLGLPGHLKRKPDQDERRYLAYHREAFGF